MLKETQPLIFDTSLYADLPEQRMIASAAEDLAGLAVEAAGDLPLEQRINAREFIIVNENCVLDPITNKDVRERLRFDSELARQESVAALLFYDYLLRNPPGVLVVSISPPGGSSAYEEARINVGYRVSQETIHFYGIPSCLSPTACFNLDVRLSEFSDQNLSFNQPDDLRQLAIGIQIPTGENPWVFLSEVALLDSKAWETILEGTPWITKQKAKRDSLPVAAIMTKRIMTARTAYDFIEAGALAERMMVQAGWKLNGSTCPGLFNSQLLAGNLLGRGVKDSFGNWRITSWEYHTGTCANCGRGGTLVGPCNICTACEKTL